MEVMPKQYQPQDLFEIVADTVISIKTKDGSGSGVILNKNGIAVTNRHVVDTNTKALVGLRNQGKRKKNVAVRCYGKAVNQLRPRR